MTATMKVTNLQNESSATPNIVLNADGTTTIAGTTATALTTSGNLNFTGTGNRIIGDFSNATFANRVAFQTTTSNAATTVYAIPNGSSTTSGFIASTDASVTNGSEIRILATATAATITSSFRGSGALLPLTFDVGGERLRLDTAGNLGLGVTPSAWGTANSVRAFENSAGSLWNFSTTAIVINQNSYFDGTNYIYKTTAASSRFTQIGGAHQWHTAPSGTAGTVCTFGSAKMVLDVNGNLGVGTDSPQVPLEVNGLFRTLSKAGSYPGSGKGLEIFYESTGDIGVIQSYDRTGAAWKPARLSGSLIEFHASGAERARIDSSGNLLLAGGITTQPWGATGNVSWGAAFGGTYGLTVNTNNTLCGIFNRTNVSGALIEFKYNGGIVGTITTNGSSTSYNTTSDYRLKENVEPMTGALAKVAALKPCTYTWKADGSDGEGFIAHELQAVVPDAVFGEKDAVDEDGNPKYQGVDTSFLVATLTAALQEQQAIITQLQADVAALKGAA